jgi:threonine dehydratase
MLTIEKIKEAQERIAPFVYKTPLLRLNNLDEYLGCQVYTKMESFQKTNSFKVRGAVNKVMTLSEEELNKGIITVSSGNHGKAVAYATTLLGRKARVVIPDNAPKIKVEGIQSYGAEIIYSIPSERYNVARQLSEENGWSLIPPFDDYEIIAGQGTVGLEILEQLPDADYIVVPIGGGGLIGGLSAAVKEINPKVKVIGVEPALVPRYSESLKAGHPVSLDPNSKSVADALQTLRPGERNYPIIKKYVDKIVTVHEENILKATKFLLTKGKLLAEISSSITIGAVLQKAIEFKAEDKVVFLLSSGNIGMDQFNKFENIDL